MAHGRFQSSHRRASIGAPSHRVALRQFRVPYRHLWPLCALLRFDHLCELAYKRCLEHPLDRAVSSAFSSATFIFLTSAASSFFATPSSSSVRGELDFLNFAKSALMSALSLLAFQLLCDARENSDSGETSWQLQDSAAGPPSTRTYGRASCSAGEPARAPRPIATEAMHMAREA